MPAFVFSVPIVAVDHRGIRPRHMVARSAVQAEARLAELEQPELDRWKREAEANAKRRPGIR
jgi:predicted transcriptional regulator